MGEGMVPGDVDEGHVVFGTVDEADGLFGVRHEHGQINSQPRYAEETGADSGGYGDVLRFARLLFRCSIQHGHGHLFVKEVDGIK